MKTKVIALDVYGTMLPTIGESVKRRGLDEFLLKCKEKGLTLCTCSDATTGSVLLDFNGAGLDHKYFDKFFKMDRQPGDFTKQPKNFTPILNHYNLSPEELLVIGDREVRDTAPAKEIGCKAILVPEYRKVSEKDAYDLSKIEVF